MKAFSLIMSVFLSVGNLVGMQNNDTLFNLCVKKMEQKGIHEFGNTLSQLDEHQAFKALCVSLLKSNTFSVSEKLQLINTVNVVPNDSVLLYDSMESDIDMHSDPDLPMIDTSSLFHTNSYQDMVQVILSMFESREKCTVNSAGFDDRTLLHIACSGIKFDYKDQISLIQLLISMGASCQVRDIHGNTPLHDAVTSLSLGVVQQLLESPDGLRAVHIGNANKQTPLHVLMHSLVQSPTGFVRNNVPQIKGMVQLLCSAGTDVTARDVHDQSPLHIVRSCSDFADNGVQELLESYSSKREKF